MVKSRRLLSAFLALAMLLLLALTAIPVYASGDAAAVSIKETAITPETAEITVELSKTPDSGILRVIQLEAGEDYESGKLNSYDCLHFALAASLNAGENLLELTGTPVVGRQIIVVLRDSSGDVTDYVSEAVSVTAAQVASEKTPEEILAGCSVRLMDGSSVRTDNFKTDSTSAEVAVELDESIAQCNLTLFAYAGNTAFDPDASQNKRLWSGSVADGYSRSVPFSEGVELKVGYKIVACLNVPVGEDWYKPVVSQSLEIVDENGNGFQDYVYPDVKIDETELAAGAVSLHITLTGDERIFTAARNGQTSIICAIAQYPKDDEFDFESSAQISLVSNLSVTEPFTAREVTLSEPLRAGHRVRAVVYWGQNEELYLVKGNDYETMFGLPDDSVLISGDVPEDIPAVSIDGEVKADALAVDVSVRGLIPSGSTLLLKSYDASETQFSTSGGTPVGVKTDLEAGTHSITPGAGSLTAGKKLAAFILNAGSPIAQSEPVVVQAAQPFTIAMDGALTTDSTQAALQIASGSSAVSSINVFLCRVEGGYADTDDPIAKKFGAVPGPVNLDIPQGSLAAGDTVRIVLSYWNEEAGDLFYFNGENLTVTSPVDGDSLAIQNAEFTTEAASASVVVSGCEEFKGGYLILSTGTAATNGDGDSRTRLGSVSFTGEGAYSVDFSSSVQLKAGNTIQAHLYRYDGDNDRSIYKYAEAVVIKAGGGQTTEPKLQISTDTVRADRTDLWITADFDAALTGTLKLYTYEGESFEESAAALIYSAPVSPGASSRKVTFGEGKLTAGQRLIAVLELSDQTKIQSGAKVIQVVPEKQKPSVRILDSAITAGDTNLKAAFTFDSSTDKAEYKLYQFAGEELDINTAVELSSGSLYRSEASKSIYLGIGRLTVGAKLQLVLTADEDEAVSNVVVVEPSPDWGTPYAAFATAAVAADAENIPVTIDYSEKYLTLGDAFYCDVTVYQFPAAYTDAEFIEKELWENSTLTTRIGQVNSRSGGQTKGQITVPLISGAALNPGDRLIIKLRLPHTEWDEEEVDYLSTSVAVTGAGQETPDYKVVLYNLNEESSRGSRLRAILNKLGIPAETLEYAELNESVGYLAGIEGYEEAEASYDGEKYTSEFMLMCHLPESLLDRFLTEMQNAGLRIDHKAVVTEYNREYKFFELIGDIEKEHDVFQALLQLDSIIREAEKLTEAEYGTSEHWTAFQTALSIAGDVLASYEPALELLQSAIDGLKTEYLAVSGKSEIAGSAVIELAGDENGSYMLTVSVRNGADADYQYAWSNGQTASTISGIEKDELIGLKATVTAENMLGQLTAQLQVPEAPKAVVSAKKTSISLSWQAPAAADNQPAPEQYGAAVYRGETLVKTAGCGGDKTTLTIDGLTSGTNYTVKLYAISPVGRSDMDVLTTTTTSGGSGGSGGGSSSGGSSGSGQSNGNTGSNESGASGANKNSVDRYNDIASNDWFYTFVRDICEKGLMEGISTDRFGPETEVTRGYAATILYRLDGASTSGAGVQFPDVSADNAAYDAVSWAKANDIASGYANGSFGVNDTITREQLAVLLHRYASYKGCDVTAAKELSGYSDSAKVSGYAAEAMKWAVAAGLMNGTSATTLTPDGAATRAQAAVVVTRFIELISKN